MGWETKTELTTPAADDLLLIQDVSDTTDSATGTTKQITHENLFKDIVCDTLSVTDPISGTFVPRYDTAANINAVTLVAGEIAATSDTHSMRIGDGATAGGIEAVGGTNWTATQIVENNKDFRIFHESFEGHSTTYTSALAAITLLNSGTCPVNTATPNTITPTSHASNANSGATFYTSPVQIYNVDQSKFQNVKLRVRLLTIGSGDVSYIGFHTKAVAGAPSDGVYFGIDASHVVRGYERANATSTSYTIPIDYSYNVLQLTIEEGGSTATFEVFNSAGTSVWSDTKAITSAISTSLEFRITTTVPSPGMATPTHLIDYVSFAVKLLGR